jgi:hypothetical protein
MRRDNDGGGGEGAGLVRRGGGAVPLTGRRCRGNGGGISGDMSNRSVNSRSEGIGVVRALFPNELPVSRRLRSLTSRLQSGSLEGLAKTCGKVFLAY